ncbi:hypothetical protein MRB53_017105 [Persea americana]|uniref:Uncharacterized protein n=1 Tax=Persea americana TaxID=3435 RepID=A0ACC2M452_PERAE|nr:hypothetical protein MRB53_017105 [Persea americana]
MRTGDEVAVLQQLHWHAWLNGRKVEFRSSENKEGIFGCGKVGFSVTVWLNICREGALDRFFLEKAITTSGEANDNFAHFDHSICRHQCGRLGFSTFQFILGFSSCWGVSLTFSTSETHSTVKEDSSGQDWIFVNLCRSAFTLPINDAFVHHPHTKLHEG